MQKMIFGNKENIHFIGIGGIGMSAIAQLVLACGCKVSGSDIKPSQIIEKLKRLGAAVYIGHSANNISKEVQLVIYSSAIKKGNPELELARKRKIKTLARAEVLALLANQKKAIAITGTHGKTTTTSLVSHLLVQCGLRPTFCSGGEIFNLNGNAFLGRGKYFVLEADESDGSFLTLNPLYSIVTNIDREHLDYYRDLKHIKETFKKFIGKTKDEGCVFFYRQDKELSSIVDSLDKRSLSFGLSSPADLFARDIKMRDGRACFDCIYKNEKLGKIYLEIPGEHNVCNALAAAGLGLEIGLDFTAIGNALGSYRGVKRRLELKLKEKDILIFDDYAHHPTEIKATLAALKNFKYKRMLAVFQPHRYTRTKFLIDDFGSCFRGTDHLVVTDIYSASESPIPGVSARNICRKAEEAEIKDVHYLGKEKILDYLLKEIKPGDLVAILGAGDIGQITDALVKKIKGSSTV